MAYVNGKQVLFSANFRGIVDVDQTFNPTSENPQSGKAVAEAIDDNLKDLKAESITAQFYERTKTVQEYLDGLDLKANQAKATATRAENVAKGRAVGYVFNTESDMVDWLMDENNLPQLNLGDNFYIRALDVPDYWWDGNWVSPLETQKVDLSEYIKAPAANEAGYLLLPTVNADGTQGQIGVSYNPKQYFLVPYNTGGVVRTNTPINDLDCANKAYVDEMFGSGFAEVLSKADIDDLVLPDGPAMDRVPSSALLGRIVDCAKNAASFEEFKANLATLNTI